MTRILSTKIYLPEISEDSIQREELLNRMNRDFQCKSHVTMICAPAGYGKTTLMSSFLKGIPGKKAWFFIDEEDNDPGRFFAYLIASLTEAGVQIGSDVLYLITDSSSNSVNAGLTALINDILKYPEPVILVLDDFQWIESDAVMAGLKFLIDYQPSNLHLYILSRIVPPIAVGKLRVKRRLTEIRTHELAFTTDEAAAFLAASLNAPIRPELLETILSRTEGWAAGIQLLALLFAGSSEHQMEMDAQKFNHTNSYIIDYLVEEVLEKQTEDVKDFLSKTSVLERMDAELCNYLLARQDSQTQLQAIEKANLFLLSLDGKQQWYRYHRLFADSLKAMLSMQDEQALYLKAANWFKEKGMLDEAIRYALKGQAYGPAMAMIEQITFETFQSGQLENFCKWVNQLPLELIIKSEVLSVRKAIALFITGRVAAAIEHINQLGAPFFTNASAHNKGLMLSLKALVASHTGGDYEKLAIAALDYLEDWDPIARTSMLNTLAKSFYEEGKTSEARIKYQQAYESGATMGYTFVVTITLANFGRCLDMAGQRDEALERYHGYLAGMSEQFGKLLPYIGIVYVALAELYYEENRLTEALKYLEEGIELCKTLSYSWMASQGILAAICYQLNNQDRAFDILETLIHDSDGMLGTKLRAMGYHTQLKLQENPQAELSKEWEWINNRFEQLTSRDLIEARIQLARMQLYKKSPLEAREQLELIIPELQATDSIKSLITGNCLLAGCYHQLGKWQEMNQAMNAAIEAAPALGYIRLFLDERPLLNKIIQDPQFKAASQKARDFVPKLKLEVCQKESDLPVREGLSKREIEILQLIVEGLSNKEISERLYISVNTTQWHISHIYEKMEVKSRTQAMIKAKSLKLT